MTKLLLSLFISSILLALPNAQFGGNAGMGGKAGTGGGPAAGCTAPATTYDWLPSATAGSSGNPGFNDAVGGNNATNSSGYPAYGATSGPNSKPALTFTASSNQSLNLSTGVPYTWTTYSVFVVYHTDTGGSNDETIIGTSGTSANTFLIADGSSSAIYFNLNGTQIQNSTSIPASTWIALAIQWNVSTGAWTIYRLSGGTATSIGSGTNTATLSSSNLFNQIGEAGFFGFFFNQAIAELGFYNGTINSSTAATYASCQYGI